MKIFKITILLVLFCFLSLVTKAQKVKWEVIPIEEIEHVDSLFFSRQNPNDFTLKIPLKWELDKFDITPEIHQRMELVTFFLSHMDKESVEVISYGLSPYNFSIYHNAERAQKLYENYFRELPQLKRFSIISMNIKDYSQNHGIAINQTILLIKVNR